MPIEKLNIDLMFGKSEEEWKKNYEQEKAKFIANYTEHKPSTREYHAGGLFSSGYYTGEYAREEKRPDIGTAEWDEKFPSGFDSWMSNAGGNLSNYGQHVVVKKIEEIIDYINNHAPVKSKSAKGRK